ncbi:MAG: hypothetical protein H7641_01690, partial [Candidatus Heimdallarchaeota archaeon]|nr:hypothetical protein [Candidatus Heimdallarchaeota archaeon]MCK4876275.1 hypothetical protein [Candidatus Heimdallarchaeota archaeon]
MKLGKKVKKKTSNTKIKEVYLKKLSLELVKRGISNKEIKSLLNEVALSLDEFISETKTNNIEELEENFGSVEQFCDNNMLLHSSEGAFGQLMYSIIIIVSLLVVPFIGFTSFFLYPY